MDLEQVKEQFKDTWNQILERLNEQEWFQELKAKWDGLDPESQDAVRYGGVLGAILLVFFLIVGVVRGVYSIENQVTEKRRLLNSLNSANQELQDGAGSLEGGETQVQWPGVFQTASTQAGLQGPEMTVSPEKKGTEDESTREVLYQVDFKHINIIQAYQFAFHVEHAQSPVKLRNLTIHMDGPEGFLDASYGLSGYEVK